MIDIAKKRLPFPLLTVLVYISYCAEAWYMMRGSMAYYGEQYGWAGWFANDIWAFFLGGLVAFGIFEFLCWYITRVLAVKVGGGLDAIRYGLTITVIAANTVLFAIKFIYFAAPLAATVIDIIITPVITVGFVALYLWYAFKQDYVDKSRYRFVVSQVMTAFITVYGVLSVIELIMAVV